MKKLLIIEDEEKQKKLDIIDYLCLYCNHLAHFYYPGNVNKLRKDLKEQNGYLAIAHKKEPKHINCFSYSKQINDIEHFKYVE